MRKDLVALGLIICFLGLVFLGISRAVEEQEPYVSWLDVAKVGPQSASYNMSVQGALVQGDRFRIDFRLKQMGGAVPDVAAVMINLTDPIGDTTKYEVPVGVEEAGIVREGPLPEGSANHTGTYKADAETIFVQIIQLTLQKMELTEVDPKYPFANLLPVSGVMLVGGSGTALLGARFSKRRRRLSKRIA